MLCSLVTYIVGLVAVRFSALGAFNTIFSRRFSHWSEGLLVDALFVQVYLIGHSPSLIQQISSDADVAWNASQLLQQVMMQEAHFLQVTPRPTLHLT